MKIKYQNIIKFIYINNIYMNIKYISVSSGFLQLEQIFTMVRNDKKKLYIIIIFKLYINIKICFKNKSYLTNENKLINNWNKQRIINNEKIIFSMF